MTPLFTDRDVLKDVVKDALSEMLREQRSEVVELIEEIIEDVGLMRAIEEGEHTEFVPREQIEATLRGES